MAYDLDQVEQIFNKLSYLVKGELDEQHQAGRIKGTEYADVFNQLMQTALTLSYEGPLKDKQVEDQEYITQNIRPAELEKLQADRALTDANRFLAEANTQLTSSKDADQQYITSNIRPQELANMVQDEKIKKQQELLTARQIEGFDDNVRQKMLEIQMNGWAMAFSSGMLECIPCIIDNDEMTDLYCYMKEQASVPGDCDAFPATPRLHVRAAQG